MTTERLPRKARVILNRLLEGNQITQDGLDWLVTATDPFHDYESRIAGYPDVTSSRTITQCYTYTTQISSPTPSINQNWNAHVFFNPATTPLGYGPSPQSSYQHGQVFATTGEVRDGTGTPGGEFTADIVGGLNVVSYVPGAGNWTTAPAPASKTVSGALRYPFVNGSEFNRLIAVGFEVVNTTAQLQKQGSVTSYRIPANTSRMNVMCACDGLIPAISTTAELICLPPLNQQEAALYPNSRTWAAEEGVYTVCTINDVDNPLKQPVSNAVIIAPNLTQAQANAGAAVGCYMGGVGALQLASSSSPIPNQCCPRTLPFDISGSFFVGLSQQSTLQVTVRYYVERLPTTADPDLLVLAKPSPCYDPMILDIYSRAMQELPVSVMVKENPLGEWFNEVMGAVSEWAPKIGNFVGSLGVPGAAALGNALGSAGSIARNMNINSAPASQLAQNMPRQRPPRNRKKPQASKTPQKKPLPPTPKKR